jgi:hypothetical protein
MRGLRYFTDRLYGVLVATGLAAFLGYSLSAWLQRTGLPTGMVDLAGDQLGMSVVAITVGAGLAALVSSRHHRRAGRDLWVLAAVSPLRLAGTQFLAVAAPVLGGWAVYLTVTALREGSSHDAAAALPIQLVSVLAVSTGVALGQLIGLLVPGALAAPTAFALAYVATAVLAGAGDDYWWQFLGPGFGDGFSLAASPTWLFGEFLWFGGVTAALVLGTTVVSSFPRHLPWLPTACTVLVLATGAALLFLNGADASQHSAPP